MTEEGFISMTLINKEYIKSWKQLCSARDTRLLFLKS